MLNARPKVKLARKANRLRRYLIKQKRNTRHRVLYPHVLIIHSDFSSYNTLYDDIAKPSTGNLPPEIDKRIRRCMYIGQPYIASPKVSEIHSMEELNEAFGSSSEN